MRWPLMLRKTHNRLMSKHLDGYTKEYASLVVRYTKLCAQLDRERTELNKQLSREREIGLALTRERDELSSRLATAWEVIANAGWDEGSGLGLPKSAGWQNAAVRWRDDYFDYIKGNHRSLETR